MTDAKHVDGVVCKPPCLRIVAAFACTRRRNLRRKVRFAFAHRGKKRRRQIRGKSGAVEIVAGIRPRHEEVLFSCGKNAQKIPLESLCKQRFNYATTIYISQNR